MNDKKFALLFLIYDNIVNKKIMYKFISNTKDKNIYIHAKYPNLTDKYFKQYIIKEYVKTEWGTMSIVNATIALLKEAMKDKTNEWFILLSGDCLCLYEWAKFKEKFFKVYENKSIFYFHSEIETYYKTSQWWILNRHDVKIILKNELIYASKFENIRLHNGAYDEYYFLSILKWNNPKYSFTNLKVMYDKWLNSGLPKSPILFNKLYDEIISDINNYQSLFIRKITKNFTVKKYTPKTELYVCYIHKNIDQDNLFNSIKNLKNYDFIIITNLPYENIISKISNLCVFLINSASYRCYYNFILEFCLEKYIKNYQYVIFHTGNFNINEIEKINKELVALIYDKYLSSCYVKNNNKNIKQFNLVTDYNNNSAYLLNNNNK